MFLGIQSYTSSHLGAWKLRDSEFHPPNVENRAFFVEVRDGLKRPMAGRMALPSGRWWGRFGKSGYQMLNAWNIYLHLA